MADPRWRVSGFPVRDCVWDGRWTRTAETATYANVVGAQTGDKLWPRDVTVSDLKTVLFCYGLTCSKTTMHSTFAEVTRFR